MNRAVTTNEDVKRAIKAHVMTTWPGRLLEPFIWDLGPISQSVPGFQVIRLEPSSKAEPWVYLSNGAWKIETKEKARYEFFLLAPNENPAHIETLAMLAHFHADEKYGVQPGAIINLGRPWIDGANCDHLLVSLPYPFGEDFEYCEVPESSLKVRFLWLMPITSQEADFAKAHGIEELERRLEECGVDVLDPKRESVKGME